MPSSSRPPGLRVWRYSCRSAPKLLAAGSTVQSAAAAGPASDPTSPSVVNSTNITMRGLVGRIVD